MQRRKEKQARSPHKSLRLKLLAVVTTALMIATGPTAQAVSFSIDWHGPTKGAPDGFYGVPITEGDILSPLYPAVVIPPAIVISAGVLPPPPPGLALPLHPAAMGLGPGIPGAVEVDALSYGFDAMATPAAGPGLVWSFSVDEFAVGLPGVPFPSVTTEGAVGTMEASADIFVDFPPGAMPPGPVPPFAGPAMNMALFDGDGVFPWGGPPLGLAEPNPPAPLVPDPGDNLDALDVDLLVGPGGFFPVYFSLDSAFGDPFEGIFNSGSAVANYGLSGGDVLVAPGPAGPSVLFAPAGALGLDLVAGFDTDDLDALVLVENGTGVYEPSLAPHDWVGGATDMLLFSVRRGSAVIGAPDSIFGIPIAEGDILTTPLPTFMGGVSPFPGIFIAAENVGLSTLRSGMAIDDDLNALDLSPDCNFNGSPDAIDILFGFSPDANGNGVPDECEPKLAFKPIPPKFRHAPLIP